MTAIRRYICDICCKTSPISEHTPTGWHTIRGKRDIHVCGDSCMMSALMLTTQEQWGMVEIDG